MPYKAISGSSTTEISVIGSTLRCNEQRNSPKECATECYDRSLNTGCPGFYTDTIQNGVCHLCHPSSSATTFGSEDVLYLLRTKWAVPEVSMDFENYTSDTIYGTGTEGTIVRLTESDHVTGVKGKGLYVRGNGYVRLTGSGSECWTNLDNCTSGMTVSFWFKMTVSDTDYVLNSGIGKQQGFAFLLFKYGGYMKFIVTRETPAGSWSLTGNNKSLNKWHLLTGTFDGQSVAQVSVCSLDTTQFVFFYHNVPSNHVLKHLSAMSFISHVIELVIKYLSVISLSLSLGICLSCNKACH